MQLRTLLALLAPLAAAFTPAVAQQVIEDFEHGNEALWVPLQPGNDTLSLVPAAAHDGALGAEFRFNGTSGSAWRARFDLASNPGTVVRWFVRARGTPSSVLGYGSSFLGVGVTPTEGLFAVFAANTNTIRLQRISGFGSSTGFQSFGSSSANITPETWYVMELDWRANGDAEVTLYDESATNIVAQIPLTATGYVNSGGFAMRGFTTEAAAAQDIDTLSVVTPTVGTPYCGPAALNSTGGPAEIRASGSPTVAANGLSLTATSLPSNAFGFFLTSRTQAFVANPGGSQGNLCLGGNIGRYVGSIFNSGAAGSAALNVDLTQMPTPTGPVVGTVGETWNFQAWYRDANPQVTSNFTDGVSVTLL